MKKFEIELVCNESVAFDDKKQTKFNLAMNAVSLLVEQNLLVEKSNPDKLRIDLFDKENINNIYEPDVIGKICHIEKSFDFDNYFAQNKLEGRKIILETMYDSITDMCQKLSLDLNPFTKAYKKVKELNYINKFMFKKLTFSQNRKHKAGIEIETNEDAATISALITDKDRKQIQKVELLKTLPHDMFIYSVIHKGKWISINEYQVSDSSGQINFIANMLGKCDINYVPKNNTIEELKEAMKELSP